MKIINETNLPYKVIGEVIDQYIAHGYEDTFYVGKIEYFEFTYKNNKYDCQVRYMKKYVEYRFMGV